MARPQGTPLTRTVVTIYLDESVIIPWKKKRFVFMQHVHKRVIALDATMDDDDLKGRFYACAKRNGYAVTDIYGLQAIDIDKPMVSGSPVSVELMFKVGEGKDEASRRK